MTYRPHVMDCPECRGEGVECYQHGTDFNAHGTGRNCTYDPCKSCKGGSQVLVVWVRECPQISCEDGWQPGPSVTSATMEINSVLPEKARCRVCSSSPIPGMRLEPCEHVTTPCKSQMKRLTVQKCCPLPGYRSEWVELDKVLAAAVTVFSEPLEGHQEAALEHAAVLDHLRLTLAGQRG